MTMTRTRFSSKLSLLLSILALATAGHAQISPQKETREKTEWSHSERMRLYAWMIISESKQECNRVLDVIEKNDGSVWATCSAYSLNSREAKRHYRVDRIPLKPGFSERWFRIEPTQSRPE